MKKNTKLSGKLYETVLIGAFLGLAVSFLLLLIMALILTLRDFSAAVAVPLSTASLGVGAFAAGFYTAYKYRQKGLLVGLCSGGVLYLFYLCIALALGSSFSSVAVIRLVVLALASALGGIFGVNKSIRQKKV